jgi:hypothetical protein
VTEFGKEFVLFQFDPIMKCDGNMTERDSDSQSARVAVIVHTCGAQSGAGMNTRRGLYRCSIPEVGECARTHAAAGDASPFLDRETYEALSFEPEFAALPTRNQYLEIDAGKRYPSRACDLIWMDLSPAHL